MKGRNRAGLNRASLSFRRPEGRQSTTAGTAANFFRLEVSLMVASITLDPSLFHLLQVSRRTVSWFRFIKSQDTQDDMIKKTNPVAKKIDNPVVTTYPVDNPVVKKY